MNMFVTEAFGPTIQGEGPHAGRVAMFLRLGGCNLSCSWCDTPYTWDGEAYDLRKEIHAMTDQDIMGMLPGGPLLVVTGGEPLLQQRHSHWDHLLLMLRERYGELHLETNGTIAPSPATEQYFAHITVSPKLPNAGTHRGKQNPAIWPGWLDVPTSIFKFVVESPEDVLQAINVAGLYGMPRERTWVMPQGRTADELAKVWPDIVQAAAAHGVNASHRLHVLAWNDERGR